MMIGLIVGAIVLVFCGLYLARFDNVVRMQADWVESGMDDSIVVYDLCQNPNKLWSDAGAAKELYDELEECRKDIDCWNTCFDF